MFELIYEYYKQGYDIRMNTHVVQDIPALFINVSQRRTDDTMMPISRGNVYTYIPMAKLDYCDSAEEREEIIKESIIVLKFRCDAAMVGEVAEPEESSYWNDKTITSYCNAHCPDSLSIKWEYISRRMAKVTVTCEDGKEFTTNIHRAMYPHVITNEIDALIILASAHSRYNLR